MLSKLEFSGHGIGEEKMDTETTPEICQGFLRSVQLRAYQPMSERKLPGAEYRAPS